MFNWIKRLFRRDIENTQTELYIAPPERRIIVPKTITHVSHKSPTHRHRPMSESLRNPETVNDDLALFTYGTHSDSVFDPGPSYDSSIDSTPSTDFSDSFNGGSSGGGGADGSW
jgi:uncharacterized membrane protein YgcG